MTDIEKKVDSHLERMKKLRNGETLVCPFCNKGKIKALNDYVFLCDNCGKGINGRVELD